MDKFISEDSTESESIQTLRNWDITNNKKERVTVKE